MGRRRTLLQRAPGAALAAAALLALSAARDAPDVDPAPPAAAAPSTSPSATGSPSPSPRLVVGLGDSVVAASHCDCAGFVSAYANLLTASGTAATGVQLGVPGATTDDVLGQLDDDERTEGLVARADVVLLMSGANEVVPDLRQAQSGECDAHCYDATLQTTRKQLVSAVQRIRALRGGKPVQVALLDYWNVSVDGQVARQQYGAEELAEADAATKATNAAICAAAAQAGATCVDTFVPFRGTDGSADPTSLLAADGDHPDEAGHQVIAEALLAALPQI